MERNISELIIRKSFELELGQNLTMEWAAYLGD
jgi:hypothetical protein